MLHIKPISDSPDLKERFIRFGVEFPRNFPYILPVFYETEAELVTPEKNFFFKTGTFKGWIARNGEKIVGRIAAMINHDMHFEKGTLGLVGLYEAESDYEITRQLLDAAVDFLKVKGCTHIWGPFSFSIWHKYRFKTDCFEDPSFIGEPQNPPYYPEYFKKYGFMPSYEWESHVMDREGMQKLYDMHREDYELFLKLGYQEKTVTRENITAHMPVCWELVTETYRGFPGYSYIAQEDLLSLYRTVPHFMDAHASFLFKNPQGEYVGYVLVLRDLVAALKAMRGKTDFFAKIRFKLNEHKSEMANLYQGGVRLTAIREALKTSKQKYNRPVSIGRAGVYMALREILNSGKYEYAVLPLMRRDAPHRNYVRNISAKVMHYSLFELNI